jgi:hypothetical protein
MRRATCRQRQSQPADARVRRSNQSREKTDRAPSQSIRWTLPGTRLRSAEVDRIIVMEDAGRLSDVSWRDALSRHRSGLAKLSS